MSVVLYSTGCPRCIALKKRLEEKGVQYIVNDDIDEMLALGITVVPVLSVDGVLMDYQQSIRWLQSSKE